jgi:hypothetical protein
VKRIALVILLCAAWQRELVVEDRLALLVLGGFLPTGRAKGHKEPAPKAGAVVAKNPTP